MKKGSYARNKLTIRQHKAILQMLNRGVQPSVIAVHFQVTRQWVGKIRKANEAGAA